MNNIYYEPYRYNYNSGYYPSSTYSGRQNLESVDQTEQVPAGSTSNESSLASQCASTVAIMGGIKAVPYVMHPVNTYNGLVNTWKLYGENAQALKGLSTAQQAEAFSTLFNSARLQPRVINGAGETLNGLRNNYIAALKSGNEVRIAQTGAELNTFAHKGVKGLIFNRKPTIQTAMNAATKSGQEAAQLAASTKAANSAIKAASGWQKVVGTGKQWFKSGGGWFCVALESIGQVPELVAAYSQGKSGDGIKQTVKSAGTVALNTAGWIAGSKVGAIGGAKLGAIIGSIFPGAGTAIGAAVGGFVGGLIGMAVGCWGANKASKAVFGKSFTEKQAQEQAKQANLQPQYKYNNPFENGTRFYPYNA